MAGNLMPYKVYLGEGREKVKQKRSSTPDDDTLEKGVKAGWAFHEWEKDVGWHNVGVQKPFVFLFISFFFSCLNVSPDSLAL